MPPGVSVFPDIRPLSRSFNILWLVFVVLVAAPATAFAQQPPPSSAPVRSTATLELAASAPLIDGRLGDDLWKQVTPISTFVQQRPLDGEPATERTEVWLAYDRSNLYVAVRAYYSDLTLLRANRVDRDQIWQDDNLRLYIDPFSDQQRAYVFAVNPYGVQGDTLLAPGAGVGGRGGRGGGGGGGGGGAAANGPDTGVRLTPQ